MRRPGTVPRHEPVRDVDRPTAHAAWAAARPSVAGLACTRWAVGTKSGREIFDVPGTLFGLIGCLPLGLRASRLGRASSQTRRGAFHRLGSGSAEHIGGGVGGPLRAGTDRAGTIAQLGYLAPKCG